jgi:hypothetical protein
VKAAHLAGIALPAGKADRLPPGQANGIIGTIATTGATTRIDPRHR